VASTPTSTPVRGSAGRLLSRLRTTPWLKPFRSAGVLLMGRTARGLLSIGYLALAARGLDPALFGTLVLLHGFVMAIGEVAKFQSWQAVVRYGGPALDAGDTRRFQAVVRFSLTLDAIGVAIGLLIVLLATAPAARLFGMPPDIVEVARLYGLSVVFIMFGATATGLLRLFDRFDRLAVHSTAVPAVRLLGCVVLYATGGGLTAYLVVWFLATVAGRALLWLFAGLELRRRALHAGLWRSVAGTLRPAPGIWRFALGTNLNSSLNLGQTHLGMLAVGALLGPAAAGLFRVAQQFANVLVKPQQKLLAPAIYPELSRLTSRGEKGARRKMVVRSLALAGGLAAAAFLALAAIGRPLIELVVGAAFTDAYGPMLLLALAGVVTTATFPLEPLLLAKGRVRAVVLARLAALLGYLAAVYVLCQWLGLLGAGIAAVVYAATAAVLFVVLGGLRTRRRSPGKSQPHGEPTQQRSSPD